jgi:hypothetical protein
MIFKRHKNKSAKNFSEHTKWRLFLFWFWKFAWVASIHFWCGGGKRGGRNLKKKMIPTDFVDSFSIQFAKFQGHVLILAGST